MPLEQYTIVLTMYWTYIELCVGICKIYLNACAYINRMNVLFINFDRLKYLHRTYLQLYKILIVHVNDFCFRWAKKLFFINMQLLQSHTGRFHMVRRTYFNFADCKWYLYYIMFIVTQMIPPDRMYCINFFLLLSCITILIENYFSDK